MTTQNPRIDLVARRDAINGHNVRLEHSKCFEQFPIPKYPTDVFEAANDSLRLLETAFNSDVLDAVMDDVSWALLQIDRVSDDKRGNYCLQFSTQYRELLVPEYGHQYHTQFLEIEVFKTQADASRSEDPHDIADAVQWLIEYVSKFGNTTAPLLSVAMRMILTLCGSTMWKLVRVEDHSDAMKFGFICNEKYMHVELKMLPFTLDLAAYNYAVETPLSLLPRVTETR